MPTRIRYHAQRKHIIYSLDALLYELHTLSFLLAPSIFVLLCRCITQFQFARVRELDGRRSLAFWYSLILLVNLSAVWSHAFDAYPNGGNRGGGAGGGGKSVVLDFVGMHHRPTKLQLLLLDTTIIFLQVILSTISYETSLALAMQADVPDPLFPSSSESSASPSYPYGEDSTVFNTERDDEEAAPFLPYTYPPTSTSIATSAYAPNDRSPPPVPPAATSSSTTITYPPTPPVPPSSSSTQPAEREQSREEDSDSTAWFSTFPKPSPDPFPPPRPVIDLTLRHILHRLISPIPDSPSFRNGGDDVLDEADDELTMLRLPLPNTTIVRVAHAVRIIAQARQRQRQREQREREREQAMARRERRRRRSSDGDADAVDPRARPREGGGGRIPGAIEDEEEG